MRIGKLNAKIQLQVRTVTGRDSYGAEILEWVDYGPPVWAELEPWHLRAHLEQRRLQGESVVGFKVRTPFDASLDKRIVHDDSAVYSIASIDATRKQYGELLITCSSEQVTT